VIDRSALSIPPDRRIDGDAGQAIGEGDQATKPRGVRKGLDSAGPAKMRMSRRSRRRPLGPR